MVSQLQRSSRTLLLGEGPMLTPGSTSLSASTTLTLLPQPQPPVIAGSHPAMELDGYGLTNAKGSSPTIIRMRQNLPTYFPPLNMTFTWNPVNPAVSPPQHLSSLTSIFANPPNHPSVYIVTYCDGHAEALSTDADCSTISTCADGGIP